eukprot:1668200-Rhodomonas_salina.1
MARRGGEGGRARAEDGGEREKEVVVGVCVFGRSGGEPDVSLDGLSGWVCRMSCERRSRRSRGRMTGAGAGRC